MKKTRILFGLILILSIGVGALTACSKTDGDYYKDLSKASFWDNSGNEAIAQNHIYSIMTDHFKDGEAAIKVNAEGDVVGKDGKIKKVAFIGFDGARADSLYNIFYDESGQAKNVSNVTSDFSGIALAKSTGGVYHAYAGGEKGRESEQSTSTSAGWISELTGGLHTSHGVKNNDNVMNAASQTIMLESAILGLDSSFVFDWSPFFDTNLRNEINFVLSNGQIKNLKYIIPSRKTAANEAELRRNLDIDDDDSYAAGSLGVYNFTANSNYDANLNLHADTAIRDIMIERIKAGDDLVSGVFSAPDGAGHTYGFTNENNSYVNAVRNSDNYAYQIMKAIEERQATANEDWLVVITADHGGYGTNHGKQYLEAKNIWLACNKPVNSKYFRQKFDGYKEN